MVLFNPGKICEELFSHLRSAIEVHSNRRSSQILEYDNEFYGNNQSFLDRSFTQNRLLRPGAELVGEALVAFEEVIVVAPKLFHDHQIAR